jgi:NCS1 family nucleobase:cation symporter-1
MSQIQPDLSPAQLAEIKSSALFNADLAPTSSSERKWRVGSFAALWISMSACIPTYMLASSLIGGGMNWWQAVLTIFLGNLIVLVPMILNAHAGTKYGISFPVYCRAAFGVHGANIPAILRALVACGWFGIQTWIGGDAIYKICCVLFDLQPPAATNWLGINAGQFACFMLFWGINMFVIWRGIDTIRFLLNIKAPLLIALGLLLLWWAWRKAGGFGPMLSQPSAFDAGQPKEGQFWKYFFPALTGMVGFWATLSLNIPDFSRYAKTQRDQVLGQALGLPATMALYSFIGVAVTSATTIIFKETLWNPVDVLTRFNSPAVLVTSLVALCIATLATNIAANVVSPANDFAHLSPRKISFRLGGYITGVIGVLMMPWKLLANPESYIFDWLGGYSALLGPIAGVLIADYFVIRKTDLDLVGLYKADGQYRFTGGFSLLAIAAIVLGALPSLPGFLVHVKRLDAASVSPFLVNLFSYSWFIGLAVAFAIYVVGRKLSGAKMD